MQKDSQTLKKLKKGQLNIQNRLDLHGFSQDEAYMEIENFIISSREDGLRYLLIITGKSGVLRQKVPIWLEDDFAVHIVFYNSAYPKDGGEGALYVVLRK